MCCADKSAYAPADALSVDTLQTNAYNPHPEHSSVEAIQVTKEEEPRAIPGRQIRLTSLSSCAG
jgi:hypothetical protein